MKMIKKILKLINIWYYKIFFPANLKIEGHCSKCGVCCKKIYILLGYKSIKKEEDFKRLQYNYPSYRHLEIAGKDDNGDFYFKCNLFIDNLCSKYKQRPLICRRYPTVSMFKYGGVLNDSCTYKLVPKKKFEFFLN